MGRDQPLLSHLVCGPVQRAFVEREAGHGKTRQVPAFLDDLAAAFEACGLRP